MVFLHNKINVRLLFGAHLFKRSNVLSLLFPHLFEGNNALVGSSKLLSEHGVVALHGLSHGSLSVNLTVESADVLLVHLAVRQAVRDDVVLGNHAVVRLRRRAVLLGGGSSRGGATRLLGGTGGGGLSELDLFLCKHLFLVLLFS